MLIVSMHTPFSGTQKQQNGESATALHIRQHSDTALLSLSEPQGSPVVMRRHARQTSDIISSIPTHEYANHNSHYGNLIWE